MYRWLIAVAWIMAWGMACADEDITFSQNVPPDSIQPGFSFSQEVQHQDNAGNPAQIDTLTLNPYLNFGDWELSLVMPYQRLSGVAPFNLIVPNPRSICRYLFQLDNAQIQQLIKKGRVSRKTVNYCESHMGNISSSSNNEVSGFVDSTVELKRLFGSDQSPWAGYVAWVNKWNNGNYEQGLGTGTIDNSVEGSLTRNFSKASFTVTGGYTWIGRPSQNLCAPPPPYPANTPAYPPCPYQNFRYFSADLTLKPNEHFWLGTSYSYQPASTSSLDAARFLTYYGELHPTDKITLRLYNDHFLSASGFPSSEYGALFSVNF